MEHKADKLNWKAISLTHVEYIEGDYFGLLLAWSSLLPIFILVSLSTLIVFRRDLHTICFFAGFLLNEALNYTLKHLIKELRPFTRKVSFTEYGMPSSHAQFIAFFAFYSIFFLYIRLHHNLSWKHNVWKHISCLGVLVLAAVVSYSRVYLLYHSLKQVACGSLIGFVVAVLWFFFVHFILTSYFSYISSWWICEQLMIRDTSSIPNIMWFEYCSQRTEAKSRQKKILMKT